MRSSCAIHLVVSPAAAMKRMRLCPRQFQLRFQRIQIQRRDVFIRHNHRPPSAAHGQQRRGVFEQSVTDVDVIGARLFRRFDFYDRHMFPPWNPLGSAPNPGRNLRFLHFPLFICFADEESIFVYRAAINKPGDVGTSGSDWGLGQSPIVFPSPAFT